MDLESLNISGMSQYLRTFFSEKELSFEEWELFDNSGMAHFISNEVVIESIAQTSKDEQRRIGDMIRKIDFVNGNVNNYLKHLAGALINA